MKEKVDFKKFKTALFYKEGGKNKLRKPYFYGLVTCMSVFCFWAALYKDNQSIRKIKEAKKAELEAVLEARGFSKEAYIEIPDLEDIDFGNEESKKGASDTARKNKRKVSSSPRTLQVIELRRMKKVPPGATIRAQIALKATDGPIKAISTEPLRNSQNELLIPSGSQFWGRAHTQGARLTVNFKNVVFPRGEVFAAQMLVLDASDQRLGLKGTRLGRRFLKGLGRFGLGVLSGMGTVLTEKEYLGSGENGSVQIKNTAKNALIFGATQSTTETLKDYSRELKNTKAQVLVKKGHEILIVFQGPLKEESH